MHNLCIIPARGGSKRIPRKNIKEFCGKPIISYSIMAAVESGVFDEVMVSTDDSEIAGVAQVYGASVPFMRSAQTADDYATTVDVLLEVVGEYMKGGREFDTVCCIYPCAPFVNSANLRKGFELLLEDGNGSVLPVCKFPVPVQWAIDITSGEVVFRDEEATQIRSQDLTPYYYDSGQFYFARVAEMQEERSITPGRTVPLVLPEVEVQDIDTSEDWKLAEIKYRLLREAE